LPCTAACSSVECENSTHEQLDDFDAAEVGVGDDLSDEAFEDADEEEFDNS
jgi:hypothetical protein